jgi:hypothetical protein
VTFGALLGLAVFAHVFILNLSYDIPVKLYSFQLLLGCIYLVWSDRVRILNFLVLNKPVEKDTAYDITYTKKWQRWARIIIKSVFIFLFVLLPFYQIYKMGKTYNPPVALPSMIPGWYEVTDFVINGDTLSITDTLHWKDLILDNGSSGSIKGHHTGFRNRYGREYFNYNLDTLSHEILFVNSPWDTTEIARFQYSIPDTTQLILTNPSENVYMHLRKKNYHFQLTEKQFHWLSEQNR